MIQLFHLSFIKFLTSAGLVYYNDPSLVRYEIDPLNCTYIPLPITNFKDALKNLTMPDELLPANKYTIETFEKISEPLTKNESFKRAHERNINRMRGKYSGFLYNIAPFTDYGIKAIKAMKRDLGIGARHRFATLLLMRVFKMINYTIPSGPLEGHLLSIIQLKFISIEKKNMSQYLLFNHNLSCVNTQEALLLQKEASHWNNLSILDNELFEIANKGLLTVILKSRSIIKKMIKELNEIQRIERAIIFLNILND